MADRILTEAVRELMGGEPLLHFGQGLTVPAHLPGTIDRSTVDTVRNRVAEVATNSFPGFQVAAVRWASSGDAVRCHFTCSDSKSSEDAVKLMSRLAHDLGVAVAGSVTEIQPSTLDESVTLVMLLGALHKVTVTKISGSGSELVVTRKSEGAEAFDSALTAATPLSVKLEPATGAVGCYFDRPPRRLVGAVVPWAGRHLMDKMTGTIQRVAAAPPGFTVFSANAGLQNFDVLLAKCNGEQLKAQMRPQNGGVPNGNSKVPFQVTIKGSWLLLEDPNVHALMATTTAIKNVEPSFRFVFDLEVAERDLASLLQVPPVVVKSGPTQFDHVLVPPNYPFEALVKIRRVFGPHVPIQVAGNGR